MPAQVGPHVPPCCAQGPQAAKAPGSCTQLAGAEFLPLPHLPTTAVKIWPWLFVMLNPKCHKDLFFHAKAQLVLSITNPVGGNVALL